jgi:hypothetical protein
LTSEEKSEDGIKEKSKKRRSRGGRLEGEHRTDAKSLSPDQALKING